MTEVKKLGGWIFYFPLERGNNISPEVTVILGPHPDGGYLASYAVCSSNDQFEKQKGRNITFHRWKNRHGIWKSSILPIVAELKHKFSQINYRRPETVSAQAILDLSKLPELFDKLVRKGS